MDFSLGEDLVEFRQAVIEFGRQALADDLVRRDREREFSRDLWNLCAEFGIQGLPIPETYGGGNADLLTTVVAMEALGYACRDNGLLFGLNAQLWSVQLPILRFGTEEQRHRYLPPLCNGSWIGAHGMTEPDAGSDAFSLRTSAERRGDEYILNGTKTFVSEAPVADLFLVFATLNRARGVLGITAFLVERSCPGLTVGKAIEKMGLRTSPMAELVFEDCRVPAENRLGREGRGAEIFNEGMEYERCAILAPSVGAMERQLEACMRYARERRQFGRSIAEFQGVSHRLVDMKVRLEAARLLLYQAAWMKQTRGSAPLETSMAKLYLSEAWVRSSLDAVQIHGGYGFTTDFEVERDVRDAIGGQLYSGTSEIQRNMIARALGL